MGLTEDFILRVYNGFTLSKRAQFFSMLYDLFSERYDEHMHSTGHFQAIKMAMLYAMPYLRTPMLDLTSGTGEPLKYAIEFVGSGIPLLRPPLDVLAPPSGPLMTEFGNVYYANEISPKMRGISESKLAGLGEVRFTGHNAMKLPKELKGRFATVLCSQTFHLISDDDKTRLVRSIRESLVRGGVAVVIEEDPFKITQTIEIEPVSLLLRAVVCPIGYPEKLDVYFVTNGFSRLAFSATAPIDAEHNMILHLFEKK